MAKGKEFKKTKNPQNVSYGEIRWEDFPLEEIVKNVSIASDIPETEVTLLGRNGDEEEWTKFAMKVRGTAAMQTALGTPYTYDQAKKYIESLGYELRLVAVAPGLAAGYVLEHANEKDCAGKQIDLNSLFAKQTEAKKVYAYMRPETTELMKALVKEYPWGVKGKIEAEIFDMALRMYAESIGKEL